MFFFFFSPCSKASSHAINLSVQRLWNISEGFQPRALHDECAPLAQEGGEQARVLQRQNAGVLPLLGGQLQPVPDATPLLGVLAAALALQLLGRFAEIDEAKPPHGIQQNKLIALPLQATHVLDGTGNEFQSPRHLLAVGHVLVAERARARVVKHDLLLHRPDEQQARVGLEAEGRSAVIQLDNSLKGTLQEVEDENDPSLTRHGHEL
mmetsp:Transcript_5286/g.15896  ORF Transcript_5286/g.15896 Transcript_5286/m.15896 type:complete len:208 (+) Transcript_5286:636-1259(+)